MKKAAAVLASLLGVFILLAACSGGAKPQDAVKRAFEAAKESDWQTVAAALDGGKENALPVQGAAFDNVQNPELRVAVPLEDALKRLTYQLGAVEKEGESAAVQAEVTMVDLKKIWEAYREKAASLVLDTVKTDTQKSEELTAYIKGMLNDKQAVMKTQTIALHLKKVEKNWKIIPDEAFWNAVSGGYSALAGQ